MFENQIIQSKNSLYVLAFAHDVPKANIDRLRTVIEKIGNKHDIIMFYESHGTGLPENENA